MAKSSLAYSHKPTSAILVQNLLPNQQSEFRDLGK